MCVAYEGPTMVKRSTKLTHRDRVWESQRDEQTACKSHVTSFCVRALIKSTQFNQTAGYIEAREATKIAVCILCLCVFVCRESERASEKLIAKFERECVCKGAGSNRATTFLNSARNTCFCVVITTNRTSPLTTTTSTMILAQHRRKNYWQYSYTCCKKKKIKP